MKNKKTASVIIRSIIFWFILGFLAIFYNIFAVTFYVLPMRIRHKIISSWGIIFTLLSKYLCNANYTVTGRENIIAGPAIIASNHQSAWETMSFNLFFPQHVWILKRELLRVPFFGWTIATLSPIAIDRARGSEAIQQILAQSIERIKNGFWILVFPEGTRVAPGVVKPFKTGVGRVASTLNLPVIPVAHNAGYVIPRKSFWIYPGMTSVVIGKAIYPNANETPETLTERIEQAIRHNLEPLIHTKAPVKQSTGI